MSSDPSMPAIQTVSVFENLRQHKVATEQTTYSGLGALRVTDAVKGERGENEDRLVVLDGAEFGDGTIEVDLAGEPAADAQGEARGFVGVAFHVAPDVSSFEAFYLRPTNGRAEDQLRRNHSAQYISFPDGPWQLFRKETPGKYESYVDLVPGVWTKVQIDVRGEAARLYVHGNDQPTLLVNELKLGARSGLLGLWIGRGTLAHFTNLRVRRR